MFTSYTRLNTGLRLQRRPELDGDLEHELHQNRAQLDAHPELPVAVLRLRQQVVVARTERASRRFPSRSYGVWAFGSCCWFFVSFATATVNPIYLSIYHWSLRREKRTPGETPFRPVFEESRKHVIVHFTFGALTGRSLSRDASITCFHF